MTKTFDIYFSVRIKAENFSDVTSKMSNIYQNIRNSINDEATLKFVHVELDEVEFSAMVDIKGINDSSLFDKITEQIKNGEFDDQYKECCVLEYDS
jgi:hypothetical protein